MGCVCVRVTYTAGAMLIPVRSQSVDTAPFFQARWKLRHNVTLLDAVHQKRVLTVNQGDAVLE